LRERAGEDRRTHIGAQDAAGHHQRVTDGRQQEACLQRQENQGGNPHGVGNAYQERRDQSTLLTETKNQESNYKKLLAEKAALGFYVTAHPLGDYSDLLQSTKAVKSIELPNLTSGSRISIGGIINDLQPRTTKKGDRFALLRLEDEAGGTKCVLWPETYRKYSILLKNDLAVLVTGRLEVGEDNPPSVIVDQVQSLDEIAKAKELVVLRVPRTEDPAQLFDDILHLINTHSGNCDVVMETSVDVDLLVRVKISSSLRVERSERLELALREVGCVLRVEKVAVSSGAADAGGVRQGSQSVRPGGPGAGGDSAASAGGSSGLADTLRRGQQIKEAARVAGQTLKEGDRSGHSAGPKLEGGE